VSHVHRLHLSDQIFFVTVNLRRAFALLSPSEYKRVAAAREESPTTGFGAGLATPEGPRHTNRAVATRFSLLKRVVYGTFHHVGRQHSHHYPSEFDFRYNSRKDTDVKEGNWPLTG
jgi:hypothetical protein